MPRFRGVARALTGGLIVARASLAEASGPVPAQLDARSGAADAREAGSDAPGPGDSAQGPGLASPAEPTTLLLLGGGLSSLGLLRRRLARR